MRNILHCSLLFNHHCFSLQQCFGFLKNKSVSVHGRGGEDAVREG